MTTNNEVTALTVLIDNTVLTSEMKNPETPAGDSIGESAHKFEYSFQFIPMVASFPTSYLGQYFAVGTEEKHTLYGVLEDGRVKEIYKR